MRSFVRSFVRTALALAALVAFSSAGVAQNPMLPNPMAPNPMAPNPMAPGAVGVNPMLQNPMLPGGQTPAEQDVSDIPLNPDFGNLPDAPGMEDTFYSCTACHSTATFSRQRLTDERWAYLWDWMITDQGMADYGPELREIILGYLTTHFSSER